MNVFSNTHFIDDLANNYLARTVIIITLYIATALFGFQFTSVNTNVTLIWIPSGIALAVISYYGYHYWPSIFIAATAANFVATHSIPLSLNIAIGNTLAAVMTCWLLQRLFNANINPIRKPRDILLLAIAATVGAFIASLNGALALAVHTFSHFEQFFDTLGVWWLGDSMGMLLIAPAILLLSQKPFLYERKVIIKSIFILAVVVFTVQISFGGHIQYGQGMDHTHPHYPLSFIPMATLLISALICGPKLLSVAIIVTTILSIIGTLEGHGPFARGTFNESIAILYLFIAISSISAYIVSLLVKQRNDAERTCAINAERFDQIIDSTQDGIWDWDLTTDKVYYSPTLVNMIGFKADEFPDTFLAWKERLHPDDKKHTLNALYEHRDNLSDHYESEYRLRCKDNSYIWILGRGKSVNRDKTGRATRMVGTHFNLTERKKREAEHELSSRVINSTPEGVLITDKNQVILDVNPAFIKTTGFQREDVIGKTPRVLRSGRHDNAFYSKMWQEIKTTGVWQGEIWNRRKSGEIYPEWLHISEIKDHDGNVLQYAAVFSDLGSHKQLREELHNFAYYDALTNLPNRDLIIDRLNIAIQNARENNHKVAILFLDLDRFKNINDTLGPTIGDTVLTEVAHILKDQVAEEGSIGRHGGDEFIIILSSIDNVEEAAWTAEYIHESLMKPLFVSGHELFITSSIGISIYPDDGPDVETLIKNADTAMYRAKNSGYNEVCFYHADMSEDFNEKLELESMLRHAVEEQQLYLEYQPQLSLTSNQIIGMEALVRWKHPELGTIPPLKFIHIAEDSGLIIPIGKWILEKAISDTAKILNQVPEDFKVAVNLSTQQLRQKDLVTFINKTLRQHQLPHQFLELEITESVLMEHNTNTVETFNRLRELGIHFSIDDFGTGYSSLSYLKKYPITKLKIDKSFIDEICTNADDSEIVSTIISMGHNLNMKVIAEGVETLDQSMQLIDRGCDEAQGYYFSRPLSLDDLVLFLPEHKQQTNAPLASN